MRLLFLGCAGGRRVTFKQHRGSGGFIIENEDVKLHIDPGPGALIRAIQAGIDPEEINAFILTHRHLDHSADINTLIEAKTLGGWKPGGIVLAPKDALEGEDPVIYRYHRNNLDKINILSEDSQFDFGTLKVKCALKHEHHGVETYGLIFENKNWKLAYITDGRFQKEMLEAYKNAQAIIINTTFKKPRELDHMSLEDAITILNTLKPQLGIIYHFGMEILRMGLAKAAEYVEKNSGIKTVAAREFTAITFENSFNIERIKLKNPLGFTPYWK